MRRSVCHYFLQNQYIIKQYNYRKPRNNQRYGKCYQPRTKVSMITLFLTLFIPGRKEALSQKAFQESFNTV